MSARWWQMSLRAQPLARLLGWSRPLVWTSAGLTISGCAEMWAENEPDPAQAALEAQREDGWNVGDEGQPLAFPGAQSTDVTGTEGWRGALTTLTLHLTPAQALWQPYFAPALFQSLEAPRSADLRAVVRPIFTPEMAVASRRGEAMLSLFIENGVCRNDVALVLDVPGPEAVALAAALAPCFEPVFVFDNWPHPKGVVPAHLTLGAALYFLPSFDRARVGRGAGAAAPMFVLDRQRLAPYQDDAGLFDNRYFAGLPSQETLQAAGVHHLLYVTPDAQVTMDADDVNDDLVAINDGGIDVRMLALSDFSQTPLPGWIEEPAPTCLPFPGFGPGPHYYFGGSPSAHSCFSWWYGWRSPPLLSGGGGAPHWTPLPPLPPHLAPRSRFHPTPRAHTALSGGWRGSPGGSWRGNPTSGWRGSPAIGSFGRSGSLGRAHGGFSS